MAGTGCGRDARAPRQIRIIPPGGESPSRQAKAEAVGGQEPGRQAVAAATAGRIRTVLID